MLLLNPPILQASPRISPHEIALPWYSVSEQTDTLRIGQIYAICGPTGFGKTVLAEQMLLHCSRHGVPIRDASTEMTGDEMRTRMAARSVGFDIADVLRERYDVIASAHELTHEEARTRVQEAILSIRSRLGVECSFLDSRHPTVEALEADIDRFGGTIGVSRMGVYILDHLLQVKFPKGGMPEEIRDAIIRLQERCTKNRVALVLFLQLNRSGSKSLAQLYEPSFEWIQGGSAIEQMAGSILFMSRPVRRELAASTDFAGTLARLRNGQLTYAEVTQGDVLLLSCLKNRDLGQRGPQSPFLGQASPVARGAGSKRHLMFHEGFYRSPEWIRAFTAHSGYDWDDSVPLPSPAQIMLADPPPI